MAAASSAPSASAGSAASTWAEPKASDPTDPTSNVAQEALAAGSLPRSAGRFQYQETQFNQETVDRFDQELLRMLRLTNKEEAMSQLSQRYNQLDLLLLQDALVNLFEAKCKLAIASLVEGVQKAKFIIEAHGHLALAFKQMLLDQMKFLPDAMKAESSKLLKVAKSVDPKLYFEGFQIADRELVKASLRCFEVPQVVSLLYLEKENRTCFEVPPVISRTPVDSPKKTDGNGWVRNAVYLALGLVAVVASVKFAMYCLQWRNKAN